MSQTISKIDNNVPQTEEQKIIRQYYNKNVQNPGSSKIHQSSVIQSNSEAEICNENEGNIDPLSLLTSNDVFDSIQMYDSTVEIIGYIDGMESPRYIGNEQQYKFFKFFLNNGQGKRVQVVAWNENINNIEDMIVPNYIIHLDGVQARPPRNAKYNNGNVPFELLIKSNTIIINMGKYEASNNINVEPKQSTIEDILNTSGPIILEGYIKTNFTTTYNNKLNKNIGCGSITDGTFKLQIHILYFDEDDYIAMSLKKGDKIQIMGIAQTSASPPYFEINDCHDINKIQGHMSLMSLLNGTRVPKKRHIDENCDQVPTKRNSI